MKKLLPLLLALLLVLSLAACAPAAAPPAADSALPHEGGYYYDVQNVVLYLELYGCLPDNYVTKAEAEDAGWQGGSVEKYIEDASIGGDRFYNREKLLPSEEVYTECDIDTHGQSSRGAKRLVFSDSGCYYYTADHYESFTELYVSEEYEVLEK